MWIFHHWAVAEKYSIQYTLETDSVFEKYEKKLYNSEANMTIPKLNVINDKLGLYILPKILLVLIRFGDTLK